MSDEKQGRGRPRAKFTMEDIGEKVMEELARRLEHTRDAAEIPGTQLMQIAQRYMNHLEEERKRTEQEEYVWEHPLALIDKEGLSLRRRYEILDEYCGMLKTHWIDCSKTLTMWHYELYPDDRPEEEDGDALQV